MMPIENLIYHRGAADATRVITDKTVLLSTGKSVFYYITDNEGK